MALDDCLVVTETVWGQWCYYIDGYETHCDSWEVLSTSEYTICFNEGSGGTGDPKDCSDPVNFDNGACQPVDPCALKILINAFYANSTVSNMTSALKNVPDNGFEWGFEYKLSAWPSGSYMSSPPRTNELASQFVSKFSWNSTAGYTLGTEHRHPSIMGPSPGDVLNLYKNTLNADLQAAGTEAMNFYKENAKSIAML